AGHWRADVRRNDLGHRAAVDHREADRRVTYAKELDLRKIRRHGGRRDRPGTACGVDQRGAVNRWRAISTSRHRSWGYATIYICPPRHRHHAGRSPPPLDHRPDRWHAALHWLI